MKITNPTAVLGEDYACKYIAQKGYKIIERNFRKGYGEIDIVALDCDTLVFIEVKTRSSAFFGSPFESVAGLKLKTLIKTAQYYKYIHPELPDSIRMDAIGIIIADNKVKKIEHLENITGY